MEMRSFTDEGPGNKVFLSRSTFLEAYFRCAYQGSDTSVVKFVPVHDAIVIEIKLYHEAFYLEIWHGALLRCNGSAFNTP